MKKIFKLVLPITIIAAPAIMTVAIDAKAPSSKNNINLNVVDELSQTKSESGFMLSVLDQAIADLRAELNKHTIPVENKLNPLASSPNLAVSYQQALINFNTYELLLTSTNPTRITDAIPKVVVAINNMNKYNDSVFINNASFYQVPTKEVLDANITDVISDADFDAAVTAFPSLKNNISSLMIDYGTPNEISQRASLTAWYTEINTHFTNMEEYNASVNLANVTYIYDLADALGDTPEEILLDTKLDASLPATLGNFTNEKTIFENNMKSINDSKTTSTTITNLRTFYARAKTAHDAMTEYNTTLNDSNIVNANAKINAFTKPAELILEPGLIVPGNLKIVFSEYEERFDKELLLVPTHTTLAQLHASYDIISDAHTKMVTYNTVIQNENIEVFDSLISEMSEIIKSNARQKETLIVGAVTPEYDVSYDDARRIFNESILVHDKDKETISSIREAVKNAKKALIDMDAANRQTIIANILVDSTTPYAIQKIEAAKKIISDHNFVELIGLEFKATLPTWLNEQSFASAVEIKDIALLYAQTPTSEITDIAPLYDVILNLGYADNILNLRNVAIDYANNNKPVITAKSKTVVVALLSTSIAGLIFIGLFLIAKNKKVFLKEGTGK